MEQTLTIENVPEADVAQTIADLKRIGATKVDQSPPEDGLVTLTATFPPVST